MKLWVFSDLHLDVAAKRAPFALPAERPECDAVVICGDVREDAAKSIRWIANQEFGVPVLFVPGNHEYYGTAIDTNERKAADEAVKHNDIHLMNDDIVKLGDVMFVGGTLWTDYCLDGDGFAPLVRLAAERGMNDHRKIRVAASGYRRFLPRDAAKRHFKTRKLIEESLAIVTQKRVVLTHHAPSAKSIDPRYQGDVLNAAFASNMDDLVGAFDLWVHGHVHTTFDYQIGGCRVVCNPRGYVGVGEVTGFDPLLIVEI